MPPKSSQRRITQSQNEAVYELGKQGRKTGLTLAERERDEHGFENVDALFSSPEKDVNNAAVNKANGRGQGDSDEEQTMEIDDESQMGPATIMKQRHNRPSLPRARSPLKTNLQSPARQNPHLGPTSSPARGSIVTGPEPTPPKAVNRRLDFSQGPSSKGARPQVNGNSKVNGGKAKTGRPANNHARAQDSDDDDDDAILRGRRKQPQQEEDDDDEDGEGIDAGGDEMDLVEEQDDPIEPEPEPEEDLEEQTQEAEPTPPAKKRRGRKPKSPVQEEEGESSTAAAQSKETEGEPAKKQRGRPAKGAQSKKSPEPTKQPAKRRRSERNSGGSNVEEQGEEQEDNVEERGTKRQRNNKTEQKATVSKQPATKEKGKPGRKRKSSGIGVDEPVVQRGPPLPKGRGLVALHREEEDNMRTTRSGRHSYKPLQFWKGERLLYDEENRDIFEDKKQRFVMTTVSGVIRKTDVSDQPRKRRAGRPPKTGAKRGRRSSTIVEEEVERDDWEYDPGRITGECIYWRPGQENQPDDEEVVVAEEELAVSEAAIQLKDIKDATFRFAKTLTMPFFGSGIVDMPPGSEKRTKNSRKMHMVFFVHSGSVEVTVAQTEFRIGKGGMWFVPRGNHYSILNDSNTQARIFFAQGCETMVQPEEGQE
ncbi:Mif2/CENP-C like-domain-containing protein [Rostrohypoxylon terebratum]|nr:Mif2/CENP-C like-domain-containing protein [Rostrohypoxylon terebratum]